MTFNHSTLSPSQNIKQVCSFYHVVVASSIEVFIFVVFFSSIIFHIVLESKLSSLIFYEKLI